MVLQPDGENICTARMDAEWAAAYEAAQRAEQADKPAGAPPEQQREGSAQAAAGAAAASPPQGPWWARLQRRRQAAPGAAQQGRTEASPAAASVELPPAAPLQQAPLPVVSGSVAASSSGDLSIGEQPLEQPQQPGHGVGRRRSTDTGAAAAAGAATDDVQRAAQAAAGAWGVPSRQRTSGSRRRPVPFYDIDLGHLPTAPTYDAAASVHADQPPRP